MKRVGSAVHVQLASWIRRAAEDGPSSLLALLQAAAGANGDVSAALRMLRSVQIGLARTASELSASGRPSAPAQAAAQHVSRTASLTLAQLLREQASMQHQLQILCIATGALLAFQGQAALQAPLYTPLCNLYSSTLAALVQFASRLPCSSRQTAAEAAHVSAGVAASCLLSSAWALHAAPSSAWQQQQLDELVAAALTAYLRQAAHTRHDATPVQTAATDSTSAHHGPASLDAVALAPYARTVLTAYSARIQNASSIDQLCSLLRPLQAFAADSTRPSPQQSSAAEVADGARWRLQMLTPLLWQIMFTARQLDSQAGGSRNRGATEAQPVRVSARLQELVADVVLAQGLLFHPDAFADVPQSATLLSSAQAVLRGAPDAAGLILRRIPSLADSAVQHIGAPPFSRTADLGDKQGMVIDRWSSCARFMIVLAVPFLRDALTQPHETPATGVLRLRACAEAAVVTLCSLAASNDAGARAAATEFVLALIEVCPTGEEWLAVLVVRWLTSVVRALPEAAAGREVQSAMHGVATGRLSHQCVLACCQLIADRAHALVQTGSEQPACAAAAGSSHEQAVDDLVGALMVAIVWGVPEILEGALRQVQGVWHAGGASHRKRIAVVVMQHLLHCHDHRKKPRAVRWYHEQLRSAHASAL